LISYIIMNSFRVRSLLQCYGDCSLLDKSSGGPKQNRIIIRILDLLLKYRATGRVKILYYSCDYIAMCLLFICYSGQETRRCFLHWYSALKKRANEGPKK